MQKIKKYMPSTPETHWQNTDPFLVWIRSYLEEEIFLSQDAKLKPKELLKRVMQKYIEIHHG